MSDASSRPGVNCALERVDLAAKRLGGMVLAATDEFFAPKENLLDPRPPVFDPDRYTDRGKEMDGWETRRRRGPGHDWCIVRLGVPGIVREAVVDTSHFTGNYPEACSLSGCALDGGPPATPGDDTPWTELLPRTELKGDTVDRFEVAAGRQVTHVRLAIYPDGGVARLRLLGDPLPDLRRLVDPGGRCDLAAVVNGGTAVDCSDRFYSSPHNLVTVGDARHMGDGWETRRRRGTGHDWAVVALAAEGVVERVEVDTTNFKGNYPDRCSLEACRAPGAGADELASASWRTIVAESPLGPHARHLFEVDGAEPATHVRLCIHPDGGVARLRVHGRVTDAGWRARGVRQLNAMTDERAAAELRSCCASSQWVAGMLARRPYATFDELLAAADEVWSRLGPGDWREAFAGHPRIGERAEAGGRGAGWSVGEQARTAEADQATLDALAAGNREYEARFGHVFLISASGRRAEDILAALRERLGNDADTELRVAAAEQQTITRLRLDKLVRPSGG